MVSEGPVQAPHFSVVRQLVFSLANVPGIEIGDLVRSPVRLPFLSTLLEASDSAHGNAPGYSELAD
jgi:hypothetical protein